MEKEKVMTRTLSRRSFLAGATLLAAGAALTGCASATPAAAPAAPAKQEKLLLKVFQPQSSAEHNTVKAAIRFSEAVMQRTNGLVEFKVYVGGALGAANEAMEGMKLGTVEAGLFAADTLSVIQPSLGLLALPFLFKSSQDAYKMLEGDVAKDLEARVLKDNNLRVLTYYDMGYRDFFSKKELKAPADFKGVKMRSMPTPAHTKLLELIGTNPVPLAWSETYTAMKTGVVDAFDTTMTVGLAQKFYEVSKYVTMSHHQVTTELVLVREDMWQKMTSETQKIVTEEAKKSMVWQREQQAKEDADVVAKLKEMGMVVNQFDITPMIPMVKPIHDEFSAQPGQAGLVDRVLKGQ